MLRAMENWELSQILNRLGGTDGARLSFMGLHVPIFCRWMNFHGRYEFLPVPSLRKASEVIVKIAELVAKEA